jgi:anti-anti-sigma regulatory factor
MFEYQLTVPSLQVSGVLDAWGMVIRCEGEIDVSSLGPLRTMLAAARKLRSPQIDLDLRDVLFFNGALLRLLLREQPQLARAKQKLTIRIGPEQLRLFRMAGADRNLNLICGDRPDEINHLSGSA